MDLLLLGIRLVLSGVLVVSGIAKLFDREGTANAYDGFRLPGTYRSLVAQWLPIAELVIAVALLPASIIPLSALVATLLFAAFTYVVARSVAQGDAVECNCFGQLSAAPTSWTTVARNGVLTLLAGVTLVQSLADGAPSFAGKLSTGGAFVLLGFVLCVAAIGALAYLVFHLWEQQGRLLLRIDALEAGSPGPAASTVAIPSPLSANPKPLPDLQLTTLDGETANLAALHREHPLLLLFTDPHCRPCTALMPDVRNWQEQYGAIFSLAVVTSGEPDAIRAYAADQRLANILIQRSKAANTAIGAIGTPSGVVIDTQGQVRGEAARGASAIRDLVAGLVHSPRESAAAPASRPVAPPPPVSRVGEMLPLRPVKGLDGGQRFVGGPSPRGQMLVFWRPDCGYCQRMLDDFKRVETSWPEDAPELVVISSGTPEANVAQGIASLVVLDEGFGIGRSVGARGTPAAVVINPDGRIAAEARIGATAILDAFAHPHDLVPGPVQ